jgi:DNA repair photolyase
MLETLHALVAPVGPGDALAPGVTLTRASTELGLRLTFACAGEGPSEGESATVHVELEALESARRYATRSERFAISYRVGPGRDLDPELGLDVCRAVEARVRENEAVVLARLKEALERNERAAEDAGAARIRRVRVPSILEPAGAGHEPHYTLSPYVGCLIGCRFCYAQSRVGGLRALAGLATAPWGSYVDVRENAPEVLADELPRLAPRPVKLCPIVSDPYHAIEAREELTRRVLEVLGAHPGFPPLVLTRSALVLRDLPLLASIEGAHVGVSLPTIDDETRAHFEPRAASVPERLDVLSRARSLSVRTFAIVQPVLPGPLEALADALAERVTSVSLDILRGVEGAGRDFEGPRFEAAREDEWQRERIAELDELLRARRVEVWSGELPRALRPA